MVSCKFSLKPIQWKINPHQRSGKQFAETKPIDLSIPTIRSKYEWHQLEQTYANSLRAGKVTMDSKVNQLEIGLVGSIAKYFQLPRAICNYDKKNHAVISWDTAWFYQSTNWWWTDFAGPSTIFSASPKRQKAFNSSLFSCGMNYLSSFWAYYRCTFNCILVCACVYILKVVYY